MNKSVVLFLFTLCLTSFQAQGQRYLPKQRGMQLTAGAVNGLNPKEGFCMGFAFSQYTKRANRWVFGAEFLENRHPYKDVHIPQSQFTAEGGHYLKLLSDRTKTVFLALGGSAMLGYETINWSAKLLPDGATLNSRDAVLYGGALTLECELYLSDRLVLLANIRERLLGGSSAGAANTQFSIGLKYIIN